MRKLIWILMALIVAASTGTLRIGRQLQESLWERSTRKAVELQHEGQYAEAERWYARAIRQARRFGPHDPRLAISLANYADALRAADQSKAARQPETGDGGTETRQERPIQTVRDVGPEGPGLPRHNAERP